MNDLLLGESTLLEGLVEDDVLSSNESTEILGLPSRRDKNRKFFCRLYNSDEEKFAIFMSKLEHDHPHVHNQLSRSYLSAKLDVIDRCIICKIKNEIPLSKIAEKLFSRKLIDFEEYQLITSNKNFTNINAQKEFWNSLMCKIDSYQPQMRKDKLKCLQDIMTEKEFEKHAAQLGIWHLPLECKCGRKAIVNLSFRSANSALTSLSPNTSIDSRRSLSIQSFNSNEDLSSPWADNRMQSGEFDVHSPLSDAPPIPYQANIPQHVLQWTASVDPSQFEHVDSTDLDAILVSIAESEKRETQKENNISEPEKRQEDQKDKAIKTLGEIAKETLLANSCQTLISSKKKCKDNPVIEKRRKSFVRQGRIASVKRLLDRRKCEALTLKQIHSKDNKSSSLYSLSTGSSEIQDKDSNNKVVKEPSVDFRSRNVSDNSVQIPNLSLDELNLKEENTVTDHGHFDNRSTSVASEESGIGTSSSTNVSPNGDGSQTMFDNEKSGKTENATGGNPQINVCEYGDSIKFTCELENQTNVTGDSKYLDADIDLDKTLTPKGDNSNLVNFYDQKILTPSKKLSPLMSGVKHDEDKNVGLSKKQLRAKKKMDKRKNQTKVLF